MNPHFTGLNLVFLDKCVTSRVRNTWLTCLAFAFRNPWVLCGLFCVRSFINELAHLVSQKSERVYLPVRPSFCWALFRFVKEGQPDGERDFIASRLEIKIYTLRNMEATFNQTAVNCPTDQSEKGTCSASTIPPDCDNVTKRKKIDNKYSHKRLKSKRNNGQGFLWTGEFLLA